MKIKFNIIIILNNLSRIENYSYILKIYKSLLLSQANHDRFANVWIRGFLDYM